MVRLFLESHQSNALGCSRFNPKIFKLSGRLTRYPSPNRKVPWRLSAPQKARQRKRLRAIDSVVDTVAKALDKKGGLKTKAVERWNREMPLEQEMLPKDKYTIFDRKEKSYRKGIHSMCPLEFAYSTLECRTLTRTPELPKWTRVSQRVNPPGF